MKNTYTKTKGIRDYEEAQQAKKARYETLAKSKAEKSTELYEQARDMASAIPFGQPILVGHHSEKRDRNYRQRIDNKMRKSIEEQKKADYYERKAASVGTGGISSYDPEAVDKLQAELDSLRDFHERMKKANRLIKSDKLEQVRELFSTWKPEIVEELINPTESYHRAGFASYQLQYNLANIKRLEGRIKEIKQVEALQETFEPKTYGVGTLTLEDQRICWTFDGKPPEAIRKILKSNGFRWTPTVKQWTRKATGNAFFSNKQVIRELMNFEQ